MNEYQEAGLKLRANADNWEFYDKKLSEQVKTLINSDCAAGSLIASTPIADTDVVLGKCGGAFYAP
ncbi:MAG: hypothetical protein LUB61_00680 [Eggerthellaceae bacterium]|nr:hypothetical protein [Eggerthellaceae bacterium]